MIGDRHHLTNSGRISTDGGVFDRGPLGLVSAAGVIVSGDDALVENTRSGVIRSDDAASAAVELNVEDSGAPAAGLSARLENAGLIRGAGIAVLGGDGEETVINHGCIVGDVDLGDGADTFVFGNGGRVQGDVFLGGGDDLVVIENGPGRPRSRTLRPAIPGRCIDVSAFFARLADLQAYSLQQGGDLGVALDHNDTLVLNNVQLSALNTGDFLFGEGSRLGRIERPQARERDDGCEPCYDAAPFAQGIFAATLQPSPLGKGGVEAAVDWLQDISQERFAA